MVNEKQIQHCKCPSINLFHLTALFTLCVLMYCVFVLRNAMLLPTMSCSQRPRWSVNSDRHSVVVLDSIGDVCPHKGLWSSRDAQWESCEVQGEAGSWGQTPDKDLRAGLPVRQPPATQHLQSERMPRHTDASAHLSAHSAHLHTPP